MPPFSVVSQVTPVGSFRRPAFQTQNATAYKNNLDNAIAVGERFVRPFAPHENMYMGASGDVVASPSNVDTSGDQINKANDFVRDQAVTYYTSGTVIGGLTHGSTYYIVEDPSSSAFQLSTSIAGAAIDLTSQGTGIHTFIAQSVKFEALAADVDPGGDIINVANFFYEGQKIQYSVDTGTGIDTATTTMYIKNATSTSFQLSLTYGGSVLAFASAGTANIHYFWAFETTQVLLDAGYTKIGDTVTEYAGQAVDMSAAPVFPSQRIDRIGIDPLTGAPIVITGTPTTGTPVAPAYTAGLLPICQVYRTDSSGDQITNDDIVDERALCPHVIDTTNIKDGAITESKMGFASWLYDTPASIVGAAIPGTANTAMTVETISFSADYISQNKQRMKILLKLTANTATSITVTVKLGSVTLMAAVVASTLAVEAAIELTRIDSTHMSTKYLLDAGGTLSAGATINAGGADFTTALDLTIAQSAVSGNFIIVREVLIERTIPV